MHLSNIVTEKRAVKKHHKSILVFYDIVNYFEFESKYLKMREFIVTISIWYEDNDGNELSYR